MIVASTDSPILPVFCICSDSPACAAGVEVARLCGAVGMKVVATRRSTTKVAHNVTVQGGGGGGGVAAIDLLLPSSELPRLLAQSDFVVLCVQWTPETEGMIGAHELGMMRDSAVRAVDSTPTRTKPH